MLQAVCSQVNRNWTSGGTIVRTTDRFWLPGCDLMRTWFDSSYGGGAKYFKDCDAGLCEETEFANHVRPSFVNGSMGLGSNSDCWLRSAHADDSYTVAVLYDGNAYNAGYANYYCGFAPACTIG